MKKYNLKPQNNVIFGLVTFTFLCLGILGIFTYSGNIQDACIALVVISSLSPMMYMVQLNEKMSIVSDKLNNTSIYGCMNIGTKLKNLKTSNSSFSIIIFGVIIPLIVLLSIFGIGLPLIYIYQSKEATEVLDTIGEEDRKSARDELESNKKQ